MNNTFPWKQLQMPYEFLMAVLAFINLYFYYFEFTGALDPQGVEVAHVIDIATIVIFSLDYLVRLYLAKDKKHYLRHNVLDLIALIPLNPVFRGARLFRCVVLFARFFKRLRSFSSVNMFLYVSFGTIVVLLTSALLVAPLEGMTFFEGIWWGVVTIATVGYGDFIPVTTPGRIIAMVLMFTGIGFLSFLTGTVTTHYVNARMERVSIHSQRGIIKHYQKQLYHFDDMTGKDIDDMCHALNALKSQDLKEKAAKEKPKTIGD
ncbi:MAG: potassium channel family protein [Clostridiales bacterium]